PPLPAWSLGQERGRAAVAPARRRHAGRGRGVYQARARQVGTGDQDREYFAGLKGIAQRLLQGGTMIDKDRRVILTTGAGVAAAAATTAAPQVFAQAQTGAVQA